MQGINGRATDISEQFISTLPEITTKRLDATFGEQAAIPNIRKNLTARQSKPTKITLLAMLMAAAAWFSLNALAANTTKLSGVSTATASDTIGVHKFTFQERIERMKSMTPEQRNHERELMRQEMESMSPDQRAEQRKEMRAHWEKMSPSEREQIRRRMKEHWKSMPPALREQRRNEMREHFKNMSPEERQQFKSDMDMLDGMPLPGGNNPGKKAATAGGQSQG